MDLTINIDNVEKVVRVEREDGIWLVTVEDRTYRVSDMSAAQGTLAFLIDHTSYIAHISNGDQGVRLSLGGRNYRIVSEDAGHDRPSGGHHGGDGTLEAPMPGNIVTVHVSEGDTVEAGQALIVLESMKMQNEITSPIAGVVTHLNCKAGSQVGFGELLAVVEPAG